MGYYSNEFTHRSPSIGCHRIFNRVLIAADVHNRLISHEQTGIGSVKVESHLHTNHENVSRLHVLKGR